MSALLTYLDLLTSGEPHDDSWLEVRSKAPWGMRQEYVAARGRRAASGLIQRRGEETDTYVGVAPRSRQRGVREAIERVHALWADVDSPEAVSALERFEPKPSMVIASGGPGRFHAYWALLSPASPEEAERANKRLAHRLGADAQVFDAPRILRPPGTHNFKSGKPVPVTIERLELGVYTIEQVVGHLADPEPERPLRVSTIADRGARADDPLLTIPPVLYVEALTGRTVGRDGKVSCCFHDDSTPSLHVYERPKTPGSTAGWKCYGCGRAGTIIDFGSALYGIEPRGRGYHEIRERLETELIPALRRAAA